MSEVSSLAPAASLEVFDFAKRGVRVEFRWTGDRFSHTILGVSEGKAVPLLESIEGIPEDRFPSSPPLVELHQQDEAIFLTGACAAGHWSMSVELVDASGQLPDALTDAADRFVLFDVACRLRAEIGPVGSEYQAILPGTRWSQSGQGALAASETPHAVFLGPTADPQQTGCRVVCEPDSRKLSVMSADENPATFPATVRWRYGVFLALR